MRLRLRRLPGRGLGPYTGLRAFAAALAGVSGVTVEITPNVTEQGHKAADLLAMVERGDLDLCYFASSYLGEPRAGAARARSAVPDPGSRPGLWAARRRARRALGRRDRGRHRLSRARLLGQWVPPHHQPGAADPRAARLHRLAHRTLDSALHQEIFRALGFEPVAIDVKDLKQAVTEGRVDAQENPLTNTVNFDLQRSHRHVSLTAHFFGVALLLANRAAVDRCPIRCAARFSRLRRRRPPRNAGSPRPRIRAAWRA
ncbi:MAG: hypothetical protein WDO24_13425 [Pseudomonadota bacterium]